MLVSDVLAEDCAQMIPTGGISLGNHRSREGCQRSEVRLRDIQEPKAAV